MSATYGRGAATTFQEDLQNSDCILIMGSNMAEAHPVGFRFVVKARERGAKVIHVDPHFSRTSACATSYLPIRTGTDIVFLGAMINIVLQQERWFKEYVLHYTNAATIINDEYVDAAENDGIFSGFEASTGNYEIQNANWHYEGTQTPSANQTDAGETSQSWSKTSGSNEVGRPTQDITLQHPNCVINILKRHYAKYTPELVAETCGCKEEEFLAAAEEFISNSGRERTGAIVYAVGWTQHSTGVQIIRAAAMLQLLLGNTGRPGGGVMAMRGHASIQGSTDIPTLYNLLPGYIQQPTASPAHNTLSGYLEKERVENGYWANLPKFLVSLLKAWFGEAATAENGFGFDWLPRITGDHSQLATFSDMAKGEVRGLFLMGQNPAAGAPNARLNREALRRLDWLVVRDFFLLESATFWKEGPEQPNPLEIGTEIFFLPAAAGAEKSGTLTNTQRLIQWHDKAVDPPGDCRSDLWFMWHLGKRLKDLAHVNSLPIDEGLRSLTWDYSQDHIEVLPDGTISRIKDEPDANKVLREINGYDLAEHRQIRGYDELREDGTTACGCWIYSGVYPESDHNRSADRQAQADRLVNPNWAFAWPANRRMMYNRASADPNGLPWSERKRFIWWDEHAERWTGHDVPDFPVDKEPTYRAQADAKGMAAIDGDAPFIMHSDGRGWLFAPTGAKDGPLPTHYEPFESPTRNPLYSQRTNPAAKVDRSELNPLAKAMAAEYPVVATTYRLTEHYLSGGMSRFDSWLNELQPAMFAEISPQLAAERDITHGDWIVITSPRGEIEARAMVTPRIRPLTVNGQTLHQIGLPIHFGYSGEVTGSQANELIPIILDPNVSMHEGKAFMCQVRRGRLVLPSDLPSVEAARRPSEKPMKDTPYEAQPEGGSA